MQDYDDSSDDGEEVERLDDNFLVNWTRFSGEVFPDLEKRTRLVNDAEQKEKTGKKESKSLFAVLTELKKSKEKVLQSIVNIIQHADSVQFTIPPKKDYSIEIDCESVKGEFISARADTLKKIQLIYDEFNKLLKQGGIRQLFPDFGVVNPSKEEFKSKTKVLGDSDKYDSFYELCESKYLVWEKQETSKILSIKEQMASIRKLLTHIDALIEQSIPKVTKEDCSLSFIAHFIGSSLLRHRAVTAVYREDKKSHLSNNGLAEKFRLELLSNSLVLNSLHQLNSLYQAALGTPLFLYEDLPSLVTKFQQEHNLRKLLKNMNALNDYILFRRLYDCIDKSKTSFGRFIKLSNLEILSLIIDMSPLVKLYSSEVLKVTNYDKTLDKLQINGETYHYMGYEGYIPDVCLTADDDIRDFVFMSIADNANIRVCRNLLVKRGFSSLKSFYTDDINQSYLIEDSLQLLQALPQKSDYKMKLLNRKPNADELAEIKRRPLILVVIPTDAGVELKFEIFYHFNGLVSSLTLPFMGTTKEFEIFSNSSLEEDSSGSLQFSDFRDERYFKAIFLDFLDKSHASELFFEPKKTKERIVSILQRKSMSPDDMPGDDIIEHAFLLVMRQMFYKAENIERATLPSTFMFTSTDPTEFLSNIRLSNRSLVRQSRNLLQNPGALMQITTIDSGSDPLVSTSKTWFFSSDKKQKINANSFFAADRQIINCKRSEKKSTLLSREHYVARVGAYSDIHLSFSRGEFLSKGSDKMIAMSILKPIFLNDPAVEYFPNSTPELADHFYFANLFFLLFGVESMRNPAMLVINMMLLDLVRYGKISIDQLFYSSGVVEIGGVSRPYFNGLMPTAPKGVTARSRELNNLYHRYMPNAYIYPGDLARSAKGTPTNRDEDTQLKLGLNHLINREALVMRLWCNHHNVDVSDPQRLAERIAEGTERLWHLPAKIK